MMPARSDFIYVSESIRAEKMLEGCRRRQFSLVFHKEAALLPAMIRSTQVLWLVRHGESTWNTLGLAQGHCDQARLTPRGVRQARAVAAELSDQPIGALYASDLRRALETAAPLAEVLGLAVPATGGCASGASASSRAPPPRRSAPRSPGWAATRRRPRRPADGGESLRDFYRRVAGFADDCGPGQP